MALVEGALSSRTDDRRAGRARPPRASGWRSGAGGHARHGPTSRWSRRCRRTPWWTSSSTTGRTPDPHPLRRDRAPGGRGSPLAAAAASSVSSCTRAGSASATPARGGDDVLLGAPGGSRCPRTRAVRSHALQCPAIGNQPPAQGGGALPGARRVPPPVGAQHNRKGNQHVRGRTELLEAGVHFGHQTRRWNPRMGRYIHGERDGIHIIDLLQTQELLEQARQFGADLAGKGGTILFVGRRSRHATRSRSGPSGRACHSSTSAGWAAC